MTTKTEAQREAYNAYQRAYYAKNKEKFKKMRSRKRMGNCAICGKYDALKWDHDHKTGEFRGFICNRCNVILGWMGDDLQCVLRFALYLGMRYDPSMIGEDDDDDDE